jgi:hypothetical protein
VPYVTLLMNVCVVITTTMVWSSCAVKRLWALWDSSIIVAMVMLEKEAFNSYALLSGSSLLKQSTVHSSMACYVHALAYNAAEHMLTY